jgi:general stress protein YciG
MARSEIPKSSRGFASMNPAKQQALARKGGQNVPAEKRTFSRDRALAASAGRKGGEAVPANQRSFSQDRALAVAAGRRGGKARAFDTANKGDSCHDVERTKEPAEMPRTKRTPIVIG